MLRHDIMDSPAWKNLSPIAIGAWLQLARRHNGLNNGQLSLSTRELAEIYKCSKDTASRDFKEQIEGGFIVVTQESFFNMKQAKTRSFRLTHWE